jgi:hypothetical protein
MEERAAIRVALAARVAASPLWRKRDIWPCRLLCRNGENDLTDEPRPDSDTLKVDFSPAAAQPVDAVCFSGGLQCQLDTSHRVDRAVPGASGLASSLRRSPQAPGRRPGMRNPPTHSERPPLANRLQAQTSRRCPDRRSVRHHLVSQRQEALCAEFRRLGACWMDAAVLHRSAQGEERPEQRCEFGNCARRHFGI